MSRIEKIITTAMGWILAVLIFAMMVDIFAEVIVRYVLHTALSFSEELGRYVFVWIVFIGMARCVAFDKHVALDIVPNAIKGSGKKVIMTLIYLLQVLFFTAVTAGGCVLYQIGLRQKSATMRIPMNLVYICIPFCGCVSLFFIIMKLIRLYKRQDDGRGGTEI